VAKLSYSDLMTTLPKIAPVVNQFNGGLAQGVALRALIGALARENPSADTARVPHRQSPVPNGTKRAESDLPLATDGKEQNPTRGRRDKKADRNRADLTRLNDLNLKPHGKPSLHDFVSQKQPVDNQQRLAAIVYYLKKTLHIQKVSHSHIYTCLKELGERVPSDMGARLRDVARRKGWLHANDSDNIDLTMKGENAVEHDLPPKPPPKT
jgi:hypothetical protein